MEDKSYFPTYFSLDDIIVTQERVPCKILTKFLNLGKLKPGNDSDDLEPGTSMDLPLWMVLALMRKPNLIKVDIPKIYQEKARSILEADARIINLFRVNQHYYEFGIHLCSLNIREHELVQNVIIQTFRERFRVIMDWAENGMKEPRKVQQLDNSERRLLKLGHDARLKLQLWLMGGSSKLAVAGTVANLRKRKFSSLEGEQS